MLDRADIDLKRRFMNDTKKVEDGENTKQEPKVGAEEGGSRGGEDQSTKAAGEGQQEEQVAENKGGVDGDAANETSAA